MGEVVVDTNVWAVADEQHDAVSYDCIVVCLDFLKTLLIANLLAVHCDWKILSQYRNNISEGGYIWKLLNTLQKQSRIEMVFLSRGEDDPIFLEGGSLAEFDPADRAFVLVALESQPPRQICNATDSDWAEHAAGIQALGLTIRQLCPDH